MKAKKTLVTINEVVKKFKKHYPDISASKIRFLESEGLLEPKRTKSNYRVYDKEDIRRLEFILKMQKEYYLPLRIIKEKISSIDFQLGFKNNDITKQLNFDSIEDSDETSEDMYIDIESIIKKLDFDASYFNELIEENIVNVKEINGMRKIRSSELELIKIIKELSKYGIQPKNLKFFENFSIRESSFIQQIVLPILMSGSSEAYKKAEEIVQDIEILLSNFRHLILRREDKLFLEKYK